MRRTVIGIVTAVNQHEVHADETLAMLFGHQNVEGKLSEVIRNRIEVRLLVLIEDLSVGSAFVAAFGLDGIGGSLDAVLVNPLGGFAVGALDPYVIPFRLAQGAMEIALTGCVALDPDNAGRGAGSATRA